MPISFKKLFRQHRDRPCTPQGHIEPRTLAESKSWLELEKCGREVISANPLQGEALSLVAYSLQQQVRLAEALEFARRAGAVSPGQWNAQFIAGYALNMTTLHEPSHTNVLEL